MSPKPNQKVAPRTEIEMVLALSLRVGMLPLIRTVLNRDSSAPYCKPYEGLLGLGGTSQLMGLFGVKINASKPV